MPRTSRLRCPGVRGREHDPRDREQGALGAPRQWLRTEGGGFDMAIAVLRRFGRGLQISSAAASQGVLSHGARAVRHLPDVCGAPQTTLAGVLKRLWMVARGLWMIPRVHRRCARHPLSRACRTHARPPGGVMGRVSSGKWL